MNLKIAIVGLPNAGKSTLFNALLKKQVADAAPYPFCTIEPNIGVVPVPDPRLQKLAEITKTEEKLDKLPPLVPAVVEFVDIAGLVKGASVGEGLGNKFLSHIRECTVIANVVRGFVDDNVVNVAGDLNPVRDRDIIKTELILADLQTLDKQSEPRGVKDRDVQKKWELITELKKGMNEGKSAREVLLDEEHREIVRDLQLLTMKPVVTVINVSESDLQTYIASHTDTIEQLGDSLIVCAKTESELAGLSESEQTEYLSSLGLTSSGLDRVIGKAYRMLGLISFLTCGEKEVRAWTIRNDSKAPDAAGTIHTDFTKKFIKAEVASYEDFVTLGGWKAAKEHGKARVEGREYVMKDGDVVEFKIGA